MKNRSIKPRLLYVHQYFNTLEMPGGTRSYELATRFVRDGDAVTMLTSDREKCIGFPRHELVDGVDVVWVPCFYSNRLGVMLRCVSFGYFSIISCFYALFHKFDVCFATSTPLTVGVPALLAKLIRGRPYVFEVRDLWPEMPIAIGAVRNRIAVVLLRRFELTIYKHASAIIALSPGMADGVRKVLAAAGAETPVATAPNSCDFERMATARQTGAREKIRRELSVGVDQKLFLYAGSLGKLNDLDFLLDLARETRCNDGIRYVIVGGGGRSVRMTERIRNESLTNLTFLHSVSKLKIPDFFAACDAGLSLFIDIPEMEKNSANKFFDTLAAGKPAIINYGGWQADFLDETSTGLRICRDVAIAAQQLGEFCDNIERYSVEKIVEAAQVFSREAVFKTVRKSVDILATSEP